MSPTTKSILSMTAFLFAVSVSNLGLADDSLKTKAQNAGDDISNSAHKSERKAKRAHRKRTGQKNVVKDAGDQVSDTAGDVSTGVKKEARKIK